MFPYVKRVTQNERYELRIEFSDGIVKNVELSGELYGEVFEPLRDLSFFGKVRVSQATRTIEWPNGADFAREFLYETGRE
jgi:Protein of unknown function (DUF2442)